MYEHARVCSTTAFTETQCLLEIQQSVSLSMRMHLGADTSKPLVFGDPIVIDPVKI